MEPADFSAILSQIQEYCGDAVVSVSLWGEPSLHAAFSSSPLDATGREGIELLIETSGVGWDPAVLHHLKERASRPPRWIVSLDAPQPRRSTRPCEATASRRRTAPSRSSRGFSPATSTSRPCGSGRTKRTSQAFYRHWKAALGNVIIQKYSTFRRPAHPTAR